MTNISGRVIHKQFEKEGKTVAFSPETLEKVHTLIRRYPEGYQRSALLPVLHIAQETFGGHLTVYVMDYVSGLLGLLPIEVYEVATFYSMYYLEKTGKYVIEVCQTGPCAISGGETILQFLEDSLKIKAGETTPDGLFTLKAVECLGSCGTAPVMQVNSRFYEKLTTEKITLLLEALREEAKIEQNTSDRWEEQFS